MTTLWEFYLCYAVRILVISGSVVVRLSLTYLVAAGRAIQRHSRVTETSVALCQMHYSDIILGASFGARFSHGRCPVIYQTARLDSELACANVRTHRPLGVR